MRVNFDSPNPYLRFIHALSWLVPAQARLDWRHEWEAEIVHRWQELRKWNRLNMKEKLDLSMKVAGAMRDAVTFPRDKTGLVLGPLNILVAVALGFGAVQEFVMVGIGGGKLQPFLLSSAAIVVSILFIVSAVAMLKQWLGVRRLVLFTGVMSILIHIYGALPPHRNMGYLALLMGAGYALVMMLVYYRNSPRDPIT